MTTPVRLQLSRKKGFDLQAWSRQVNGLPAVKVTRPGKWGNPFNFRPAEYCWIALHFNCRGDRAGRQEASVKAFCEWIDPQGGKRLAAIEWQPKMASPTAEIALGPLIKAGVAPALEEITSELRGANLACWCALCARHAKTGGKAFDEQCSNCAPCHCDVLLELANRPICEEVG